MLHANRAGARCDERYAWAAQPPFLKGSRVAGGALILLALGASWRLRGT